MRAPSSATAVEANPASEQVFGENDPAVRAIEQALRRLHDGFRRNGEKPAPHIAARARVTPRAVEHWTARDAEKRREMSARAFVSLLISDVGGDLLDAVMKSLPAKERPRWWLRHANAARLAEIEKLQAEADQEIRQLRLALLK